MTRDFESVRSDHRNSKAISQCVLDTDWDRFVCFQCLCVRCAERWLNTNDLAFRFKSLDSKRNTSNETCSSNGNDNYVNVRNILNNLDSDRTGTGDYGRIIISIDVGESFLFDQRLSIALGFSYVCSFDDDASVEFSAFVNLCERCYFWHDHGNWDSKFSSMVSQRQSMITCRRSNDTFQRRTFLSHEMKNSISCSSFLE
mmetsp:Transcript_68574/g.198641  ORF Transcript_68574/g.198641 Transcript_68574/m.198641 type:complete len:200 (+) Transcript_68574:159-758(+)